jgi:hypothetical protein
VGFRLASFVRAVVRASSTAKQEHAAKNFFLCCQQNASSSSFCRIVNSRPSGSPSGIDGAIQLSNSSLSWLWRVLRSTPCSWRNAAGDKAFNGSRLAKSVSRRMNCRAVRPMRGRVLWKNESTTDSKGVKAVRSLGARSYF